MAPREPARRHSPRLRSRPLLLVVCSSARTEGDYLKGLRAAAANRAVDLRIVRDYDKARLKFQDFEPGVHDAEQSWSRA
jgi:hypothetical protein